MKKLVFFLISLSLLPNLFGQKDYTKFKRMTTKHGLSDQSIWSICQDDYGFMWFGTDDGLNKYDGSKFLVYKNDPKDSNSLINNRIKVLYKDHNGNIWIGTTEGMSVLNIESQSFKKR